MILTQGLTAGTASGDVSFALGTIIGKLQGDLLLTVMFPDGETVHERLDMSGLLSGWVSEICHSKFTRDRFPIVDGKVVERND